MKSTSHVILSPNQNFVWKDLIIKATNNLSKRIENFKEIKEWYSDESLEYLQDTLILFQTLCLFLSDQNNQITLTVDHAKLVLKWAEDL